MVWIYSSALRPKHSHAMSCGFVSSLFSSVLVDVAAEAELISQLCPTLLIIRLSP